MNHIIIHGRKLIIAFVGFFVLAIGVLLLAYPGPGWLIIFGGLAILATEFKFARKTLDRLKIEYEKGQSWFNKRHLYLRLTIIASGFALAVVTVWLINGYGAILDLLNIHIDWIRSPLLK
jgi:uncharacterized protein (TIGR02611 family)